MNRSSFLCRLAVVAAVVSVMLSCDRTPDHVINKKEMASLLVDIHKAEGVVDLQGSRYRTDSAKKVLRQSVYADHGVTKEQFDTSLVWYGHNMEVYKEVYEQVIKQLEEELSMADIASEGVTVQVAVAGDSVDVWPDQVFRRFASTSPSDIMRFKLTADENWEKGDTYSWRFFANSHANPMQWTICADYNDGTVDYTSGRIHGGGWQELTLPTDTARTLRYVYGMLLYPPAHGEVTYADSISLTRTRFNPDEYKRGSIRQYKSTL